jgi:hypothetical protein
MVPSLQLAQSPRPTRGRLLRIYALCFDAIEYLDNSTHILTNNLLSFKTSLQPPNDWGLSELTASNCQVCIAHALSSPVSSTMYCGVL